MIDPKLNELPAGKNADAPPMSEAEKAERAKGNRAGLSINDTIAGDTLLSTGSRGLDTSGVSAGAGAGAGLSTVTPGRTGESPAPAVVTGPRSSGTTPRGAANTTDLADSTTTEVPGASSGASLQPNTTEIAERAYQIWYSKGCPEGTSDEDWRQAERELRGQGSDRLSRAATSV
ncbi:MAG: hypothetical protein JWP08_1760 [Bryobacterales bacterium]|jgi:DUF2934 family protein|nr:hypothetical protein [Bryobacterales bacterium]